MFSKEQYYDLVVDLLIGMDETRKPDRDTVDQDYDDGKTPEDSAQAFYDDWNLD